MSMKKLLALVLALTMVLSVSAAAAYTVAPYGDAEQVNEDCEVAVQLLYSLDIMKGDDKGNFRPEATITRAEMAKMIYVILNYGEDDKAINYTGANIFSDVKAGEWYEGYVNYMAMTKLVQGRPDGTFGPNAPITTAEAAKMLLTAIGYSAEDRAYVGAGWDKQVLSDASIIGLLKNYNYRTTGYAPRQWVAVMVKNALIDARTYGTIAPIVFNGLLTGSNYPAYEYPTMGWKYFELYEWSGVVMANEYADLYDNSALSSGRTQVVGKDQNITFTNWSTDLTDIGESRWGYAIGKKVMYAGDTGDNVTFSTGDATTISKKYVGVYVDEADYYVDFEKTAVYGESKNGEWLKVIDNNDDGEADFVFVTKFIMSEVQDITRGGIVELCGNVKYDDGDYKDYMDYETSEEALAVGDIVLYVEIDGTCYIELAPSFTGTVDKYTYKTDVLTVEGEDYVESDIKNESGYPEELENALRKTEYTYYQDFFNHIRIYVKPVAAAGDLVLLTDAYYETNRNGSVYAVDAYLDGEIVDSDVNGSYIGKNVNGVEGQSFFDRHEGDDNNWGRLFTYAGDRQTAMTNVARYGTDDDGALKLYNATTYVKNKAGSDTDVVATDYIDLDDDQIVASEQRTYMAADGETRVQANKDTVFYYVYENTSGAKVVTTAVGYKNSYDVCTARINRGITAMYAVATDTKADSVGAPYWVADVIVVETLKPVFNLNDEIVLTYDVLYKAVYDYADVAVIGADAALGELHVTSVNGYDSFKQYNEINVLGFYYNTEDEDGDSYIDEITENFAANDIYVGKVDRDAELYDYVVAIGGDELEYTDATIVYDVTEKPASNYVAITDEDKFEDPLKLIADNTYIFFAPDKEVVYAILVDDAFTAKLADAIAYDALSAEDKAEIEADKALAKAIEDAEKALNEYAAAVEAHTEENFPMVKDVTAADLAEAIAAEMTAIKAMTDPEAIAEYIATAEVNLWNAACEKQIEKAAKAEADAQTAARQAVVDGYMTKLAAEKISAPVTAGTTEADLIEAIVAAVKTATGADENAEIVVVLPNYELPQNGKVTIEGVTVQIARRGATGSATIAVDVSTAAAL